MCTARMTIAEKGGVVDSDLRAHGIQNLMISNAIFPSGAATNPTLTLVALTLRFADHVL
jgi:choline dehydrogenase-like flavoprotein